MKNPKQRFGFLHENIKTMFWNSKTQVLNFQLSISKEDFAWKAWNRAGIGAGAGARTGAGAGAGAGSNPADNFIFLFYKPEK